MKKLLTVLCILTLSLSGCSMQSTSHDEKIQVYTSFYAMYDFASKVGGDKLSITNLVPPGIEPHDWEPSPSDIINLENADIFIYSGLGFEHWVDKVLQSISDKKFTVINASEGLALMEGQKHGNGEDNIDPHVWLSIKNAKMQMENIKNSIITADPKNAQYYEENYNKFAKEFDVLDKEYSDTLSVLPNNNIVVSHEAFGYLCKDYGLNQVAIEGLSPDYEPSSQRMAQVIDFVKKNNVKVIFFEELVSPKVAETIANAAGVKTDVLNPIEGLNDEQLKNGGDYLSVMRENLKALKAALE